MPMRIRNPRRKPTLQDLFVLTWGDKDQLSRWFGDLETARIVWRNARGLLGDDEQGVTNAERIFAGEDVASSIEERPADLSSRPFLARNDELRA